MKTVLLIVVAAVMGYITTETNANTQVSDLKKPSKINSMVESPSNKNLNIGGAVRVNYSYKEYDEQSKVTLGSLDFELFRLNVTSEIGQFKLFAQYRWYSEFSVPEYAYMSLDLTDNSELQLGLNKVPFGVLPY